MSEKNQSLSDKSHLWPVPSHVAIERSGIISGEILILSFVKATRNPWNVFLSHSRLDETKMVPSVFV